MKGYLSIFLDLHNSLLQGLNFLAWFKFNKEKKQDCNMADHGNVIIYSRKTKKIDHGWRQRNHISSPVEGEMPSCEGCSYLGRLNIVNTNFTYIRKRSRRRKRKRRRRRNSRK